MRTFVGNASHELRTPLTSVKLQVGALADGACEEPEVAQRFLRQIDSEIDRLVYMVNDMLDLSQIEGGGAPPEMKAVNLTDLSNEVLAFWEARSRQAGITLLLTTDSTLPVIRGDPYRLRQLLDNLLDNAIKYTPPGGQVEIFVQRIPGETGARQRETVRIEVRDTGVGIDPEHLPYIFDRFYRIEMGRKQPQLKALRPMGSGLGLAIARSIVTSHGGQIGVESQSGRGTTFWVELPIG
jgi:signal transduction histidine kinase